MKKRAMILVVIVFFVLAALVSAFSQQKYEILDVKMKEISRSERYVEVSWMVKVQNNTDVAQEVYVKVKFLDRDGFQVEDSIESATLAPRAVTTVTSTKSIKVDVWSQIKSIQAYL